MLRRHPEILRARLVISGTTGADRMVLKTESRVRGEDLAKRIADSLRDRTKLRGDVEWVDVGGLPNDGKVIDDVRTYEYARGGRGRPRTPQPASPLSP